MLRRGHDQQPAADQPRVERPQHPGALAVGEPVERHDVEPNDFTIATVPKRYAELGDLHAGIDDAVFDIAPLLEWAERDEAAGAEPPPEPEDDTGKP